MTNFTEGSKEFRSNLAQTITDLRYAEKYWDATNLLTHERKTVPYKIARELHLNPEIFLSSSAHFCEERSDLKGEEVDDFHCFTSNEFYKGLERVVQNLGGVGLAVGPDQGLDFYNMANLNEVYCIDISPQTHLVTRTFLEIGLRLKTILGRYPSVSEYMQMFEFDNVPITLSLLAAPSLKHTFSQDELEWLAQNILYGGRNLYSYLDNKSDYYRESSWIGTDKTLQHTIEGYEQDKVHVVQGSIIGSVIPTISKKLTKKDQKVTLIYLSNAPDRNPETYLNILKQLPLTHSSIMIYSAKEFLPAQFVPRPKEFDGILNWQIIYFPPLGRTNWPKPNDDFKEISPGCYQVGLRNQGDSDPQPLP